jgi:hypothetical protein
MKHESDCVFLRRILTMNTAMIQAGMLVELVNNPLASSIWKKLTIAAVLCDQTGQTVLVVVDRGSFFDKRLTIPITWVIAVYTAESIGLAHGKVIVDLGVAS